jgi:undecaprenyl-diphosphatase
MSWLEAIVLGVIQGITEFLPISSDGHLAVAEQGFAALRGSTISGPESLFFNVMLHLGTLAAIGVYYRAVAATACRGLLSSEDRDPAFRRGSLIRVGLLTAVATLPAVVVGLGFKEEVEQATASPVMAAAGFLITAAVLATTPMLGAGQKAAEATGWLDATLIGCAQAFAILPGVSRSGMTIATALVLGLSRPWAVGFSLLMAAPAILGAAVLELKDVDPATLTADRVAQTATATVVAGLVGYVAIVWLIRIVRKNRLWYFSVYLVLLALVVLAGAGRTGSRGDGERSGPLDRAVRRVPHGARPDRLAGRPDGPLAGPHSVGAGAGPAVADAPLRLGVRPEGLELGRPLDGGPQGGGSRPGPALAQRDPGRPR